MAIKKSFAVDAYRKSVRVVRKMRADTIWKYADTPHEAKCQRVLEYMISRSGRNRRNERMANPEAVGRYSGLTRSELARTGTCETDWF